MASDLIQVKQLFVISTVALLLGTVSAESYHLDEGQEILSLPESLIISPYGQAYSGVLENGNQYYKFLDWNGKSPQSPLIVSPDYELQQVNGQMVGLVRDDNKEERFIFLFREEGSKKWNPFKIEGKITYPSREGATIFAAEYSKPDYDVIAALAVDGGAGTIEVVVYRGDEIYGIADRGGFLATGAPSGMKVAIGSTIIVLGLPQSGEIQVWQDRNANQYDPWGEPLPPAWGLASTITAPIGVSDPTFASEIAIAGKFVYAATPGANRVDVYRYDVGNLEHVKTVQGPGELSNFGSRMTAGEGTVYVSAASEGNFSSIYELNQVGILNEWSMCTPIDVVGVNLYTHEMDNRLLVSGRDGGTWKLFDLMDTVECPEEEEEGEGETGGGEEETETGGSSGGEEEEQEDHQGDAGRNATPYEPWIVAPHVHPCGPLKQCNWYSEAPDSEVQQAPISRYVEDFDLVESLQAKQPQQSANAWQLPASAQPSTMETAEVAETQSPPKSPAPQSEGHGWLLALPILGGLLALALALWLRRFNP